MVERDTDRVATDEPISSAPPAAPAQQPEVVRRPDVAIVTITLNDPTGVQLARWATAKIRRRPPYPFGEENSAPQHS